MKDDALRAVYGSQQITPFLRRVRRAQEWNTFAFLVNTLESARREHRLDLRATVTAGLCCQRGIALLLGRHEILAVRAGPADPVSMIAVLLDVKDAIGDIVGGVLLVAKYEVLE